MNGLFYLNSKQKTDNFVTVIVLDGLRIVLKQYTETPVFVIIVINIVIIFM